MTYFNALHVNYLSNYHLVQIHRVHSSSFHSSSKRMPFPQPPTFKPPLLEPFFQPYYTRHFQPRPVQRSPPRLPRPQRTANVVVQTKKQPLLVRGTKRTAQKERIDQQRTEPSTSRKTTSDPRKPPPLRNNKNHCINRRETPDAPAVPIRNSKMAETRKTIEEANRLLKDSKYIDYDLHPELKLKVSYKMF